VERSECAARLTIISLVKRRPLVAPEPRGVRPPVTCVEECPVAAIFPEYEIPAEWVSFIEKNAAHFRK
jgi:hypothetical protein